MHNADDASTTHFNLIFVTILDNINFIADKLHELIKNCYVPPFHQVSFLYQSSVEVVVVWEHTFRNFDSEVSHSISIGIIVIERGSRLQ